MEYIYLHGFASSPESAKAQNIKKRFDKISTHIKIPDLNAGNFSELTISRQINQVVLEFDEKQAITLIGSSLGGLTSAHIAEKYESVQKIVLLAPAFAFLSHWLPKLGDKNLQLWQKEKYLSVYHHREKRELPLSYDFITDALLYQECQLQRAIPTLIIHGLKDEVIPIEASRNYSVSRPWVQLVELDSDHALGNVFEDIWQAICLFCHL
jgi:uncharacterized protein